MCALRLRENLYPSWNFSCSDRLGAEANALCRSKEMACISLIRASSQICTEKASLLYPKLCWDTYQAKLLHDVRSPSRSKYGNDLILADFNLAVG
jgi:hypothetical protein